MFRHKVTSNTQKSSPFGIILSTVQLKVIIAYVGVYRANTDIYIYIIVELNSKYNIF